jgi:hypothetical protein
MLAFWWCRVWQYALFLVLRIVGRYDTNSPYIDYICIIIVDVATLPFAAESERPQSALRRCAGSTMCNAMMASSFGSWRELKKKNSSHCKLKVAKTLACVT